MHDVTVPSQCLHSHIVEVSTALSSRCAPVEGSEHVGRVGVAVGGLAREQLRALPARLFVEGQAEELLCQCGLQPAEHLLPGAAAL